MERVSVRTALAVAAIAAAVRGFENNIEQNLVFSTEECDPHYESCTPETNPEPHPCARPCRSEEAPRTCYYKMVVEWGSVLGKACYDCPLNISDCYRPHCIHGDGVERGVITINRRLPGNTISVCLKDRIVVDLVNRLPSTTTSIHWHGLYMHGGPVPDEKTWSEGGTGSGQRRAPKFSNPTPWSDGVVHLTQCPVLPGQTYRYKFSAYPAGTYWYHSHSAFQREDGFYGKLIIRQPPEQNIHRDEYDEDLDEHVIIFQDWVHKTGLDMFIPHHWDDGTNKADSFLINGKGRFRNFGVNKYPGLFTPVEEFRVEEGKRYRFRLISAGVSLCPVQFSVEGHQLRVIASDGADIKPVYADSLIIHNGERYDVVIDTKGKEKKTYLIKFGGLFDCGANKVHGTALLKYSGASDSTRFDGPTSYSDYINIPGVEVNALNTNPGNPNKITVAELRSAVSPSEMLPVVADRTIYAAYSFYDVSNPDYHHEQLYAFSDVIGKNKLRTPMINNITMHFEISPYLTQPEDVDRELFCNEENITAKHCRDGFCRCYHLYEVRLGDLVDLFLIDEGLPWDVSHPFHLHGMHFQVLGMERFAAQPNYFFGPSPPGNNIRKEFVVNLDKEGRIPRNTYAPPLKDTVVVPDAGYTLVRIKADNPGYWFFHCHMSWHDHIGMGFVIKIGEDTDMAKPPQQIPKCGNFI